MADPVTLSLAAMAAGTVLSSVGKHNEGVTAQNQANYEASQMDVNAGQQRAMAQRQAIEDRRAATLANSKLQAAAAAGGGSASDAGTVDLSQDIYAQGEYNALTSLYNGEEKARDLEGGASLKRYQGKEARKAGDIAALSSVLSGVGSMGLKYGGGGPSYYNSSTGSAGASSSTYRNGSTVYWR